MNFNRARAFVLAVIFLGFSKVAFGQQEVVFKTELELGDYTANDAVIKDNYLILVDELLDSYALIVYDITDYESPSIVFETEFERDLEPHSLLLNGNTLWISGDGGDEHSIEIFDFTDPSEPILLKQYASLPFGDNTLQISDLYSIRGDRMFAQGGLFNLLYIDISDLNNLKILGGYGDAITGLIFSGIDYAEFIDDGSAWLDNDDFRHLTMNSDGSVTRGDKQNVTGELYSFEILSDNETAYASTWTGGPKYLATLDLTGNVVTEKSLLDMSDSIGYGFSSRMEQYEEKDLIFVQGEISFLSIDISDRDNPKMIKVHEGGSFIKRFDNRLITGAFGGDILIYEIGGGSTNQLMADFELSADEIEVGNTIMFTDLSTGDITGWNWEFEGGTPNMSTEQNPSVLYDSIGVFPVSLEITTADTSITVTKNEIVKVISGPLEVGFSADSTTVLQGNSVVFLNESSSDTESYIWYFEGGSPGASTEKNPTVTYKSPGTYGVQLEAFRNGNSEKKSVSDYIEVLPDTSELKVIIDVNTPNIFENASIKFKDFSTGKVASRKWTFEGGSPSTSTDASTSVTYPSSGTYDVQLSISDGSTEIDTIFQDMINVFISEGIEFADTVIDSFYSGVNPQFDDFYGGTSTNFPVSVEPTVVLQDTETYLSLPIGSYVTVGFNDNFIINAPNQDDLFIEESAGNNEYADVYVSSDGLTFSFLGTAIGTNSQDVVSTFDLQDIDFQDPVNFVKVVGLDLGGGSPGYDLKSVSGVAGAVKLADPDSLVASFSVNSDSITVGDTAVFSNESQGMLTSLKWKFQGGTPSESSDIKPEISYLFPGSYSVELTVNDSINDKTNTFLVENYITVFPDSTETCSGQIELVTDSVVVNDGSGDLSYSPNLNCSWILMGASDGFLNLQIQAMDIAEGDTLRIFDGTSESDSVLALFPSATGTEFNTSSNSVLIKFQSDDTLQSLGWDIEVTRKDYFLESPSDLVAKLITGNFIELSWSDNSELEDNFIIEKSIDSDENFVEIGSVPGNTEKFVDGDVERGFEYFYKITAVNENVESESSDITSISVELLGNSIKENFKVYPVPSRGTINISGIDIHRNQIKLSIISLDGRKRALPYRNSNNSSLEVTIPPEFQNGLFWLHLETSDGTANLKIVLER